MSTLAVATIRNLSGTASTSSDNVINGCAKAWVNFNGTTSPGTIRASYNVSSVTKNGAGDYTVNFTNALPDANFCVQIASEVGDIPAGTAAPGTMAGAKTTTSARVGTMNSSAAVMQDRQYVGVAVFR